MFSSFLSFDIFANEKFSTIWNYWLHNCFSNWFPDYWKTQQQQQRNNSDNSNNAKFLFSPKEIFLTIIFMTFKQSIKNASRDVIRGEENKKAKKKRTLMSFFSLLFLRLSISHWEFERKTFYNSSFGHKMTQFCSSLSLSLSFFSLSLSHTHKHTHTNTHSRLFLTFYNFWPTK